MRKVHLEAHKNNNHKKEFFPNPLSPNKKEFELLYRERDHQQCAEPYESIIFMKSKKCQTKPAKDKANAKNKKQSAEDLKRVIHQLEQQLNTQQGKQSRKEHQSVRSCILKNTTNNTISKHKKESFDKANSRSSGKWTKYKNQDSLGIENARKYKNILSPNRNIKNKADDTCSTKFMRSTQQTFRRQTKPKNKKIKKQNISPDQKLALQPVQEYVLLQDNFVAMDSQQAYIFNQKILSSRQIADKRPNWTKQKNTSPSKGTIQEGDQQNLSNFIQDYQSDEAEYEQQDNHIFYENNLDVVQKYIISKIKIIQKWWRQQLQHKHNISPILFQEQSQSSPQPIREDEEEQREEFHLQSEESMVFGSTKTLQGQAQSNPSSPIKMIDDFNLQCKAHNEPIHALQMRQNAAKLQMSTHKQILQRLFANQKISEQAYFQKKGMIQAKYFNQLRQIEQIKKILRQNTEKAFSMARKTKDDIIAAQHLEQAYDQNVLDQIFGKQFCQAEHTQQLTQVPALQKQYIPPNRQKSTGCHYNSDQQTNKLYLKKQQEEHYEEDFEDEQEQLTPEEYHQLYSHNIHDPQTYNTNFKELMDQFKVRQEVKMQIDKRAAIQMGVISEQIPQQIKNQYVGIQTSLNSIHRFLLAFFKFYIYYYKDEFLRLINMPFGYNIDKRMKFLQGRKQELSYPEQDEDGVIYGLESVISQQILDEFYEKVYDLSKTQMNAACRANFQFDKIHNRALFDCFNEGLNHFRPYFLINGPPYPWNNSEKALTFYFIAEENIQQVFEKTQFKVLKWASTLCGIIVTKYSNSCPVTNEVQPVQSTLELYKNSSHPLLFETRQDRASKNEKIQLIEGNHEWATNQEQKTAIYLQASQFVFAQLVLEMLGELERAVENKQVEGHMRLGLECFHNLQQNSSKQQIQIY